MITNYPLLFFFAAVQLTSVFISLQKRFTWQNIYDTSKTYTMEYNVQNQNSILHWYLPLLTTSIINQYFYLSYFLMISEFVLSKHFSLIAIKSNRYIYQTSLFTDIIFLQTWLIISSLKFSLLKTWLFNKRCCEICKHFSAFPNSSQIRYFLKIHKFVLEKICSSHLNLHIYYVINSWWSFNNLSPY